MTARPELVRSIGRWSLAGLVLNGIIGSGVFVQPGLVGGALGWSGMMAWVIAALFTAAMIFSFAEVASRFTSAGGAYLYTQLAFGRFAGLQMGWMTYFVRAHLRRGAGQPLHDLPRRVHSRHRPWTRRRRHHRR